MKTISVFAGSESHKEKQKFYYQLAYETGKALARAGFRVATGSGPGLMNEVMRGAHEAGGETVGVALAVFGRAQSQFVSEQLTFHALSPRQDKLIALGDAYIALPGGIGTLYEICNILALKRVGEMPLEKPLILIDGFYTGFDKMFDRMIGDGFVAAAIHDFYKRVETPQEAVDVLLKKLA